MKQATNTQWETPNLVKQSFSQTFRSNFVLCAQLVAIALAEQREGGYFDKGFVDSKMACIGAASCIRNAAESLSVGSTYSVVTQFHSFSIFCKQHFFGRGPITECLESMIRQNYKYWKHHTATLCQTPTPLDPHAAAAYEKNWGEHIGIASPMYPPVDWYRPGIPLRSAEQCMWEQCMVTNCAIQMSRQSPIASNYPKVPSRAFPLPLSQEESEVPPFPQNGPVIYSYYRGRKESRTIIADLHSVEKGTIPPQDVLYMRQVLQRPDLTLRWKGMCDLNLEYILQVLSRGISIDPSELYPKFKVYRRVVGEGGGSVWEAKDIVSAKLQHFVVYTRSASQGQEPSIECYESNDHGIFEVRETIKFDDGGLYLIDFSLKQVTYLDDKYRSQFKITEFLPGGLFCATHEVCARVVCPFVSCFFYFQ